MGDNMKVYVLIMGDEYEPDYTYGVYSTLDKAKVAMKEAQAYDSDDEGFFVKVVELDGEQSFNLDTWKTIEL
jgi:hypothetical protein